MKTGEQDQCSFCDNQLPEKPYKIVYEDENGKAEAGMYSLACEECALILSYMGERLEEIFNEKLKDKSV